ncbi:MAG: hypothetical protein CVU54_09865 [Deltaproteobacteria bacterium HGW-Deltaproteobacteria-12]|jgi:hypothetical protein|nr:MAG: hypothetical protein CVU54_09865 [Deltaproteobacteria bacterium HGW-Deltaproteobacteria-12]
MTATHTAKLIETIEYKAREIAEQWYKNVKINPKTPIFHKMHQDDAVDLALKFYTNYRKLFDTDNPFEEAHVLFSKYAADCYKKQIPLPEAIYSIILMRRHMWLFVEYQAVFETAVEQRHALESQSRMILMFDYAEYVVILTYDDLVRNEVEDKFKGLKVKTPFFVLWPGGGKEKAK